MATQTQGKGKKKNKEVMKVSLDEFNQIDAPHGHSVVSLKMTGLDWAETMADYDQQTSETQQIIVPAAPRAQRGPAIAYDSLPNEPPFRVSLFNLPMSVDDKDITDRFFQSLAVTRVEISKSSTTVELGSKEHLYEALCKDGTTFKNRTVTVCLYGQSPQNNYNSDRYGGRSGNSSYGDRFNDRHQGGYGGQRANDRYGDRSGGFGRDRDNYSGGGFGRGYQRSGGYSDRYNDRNNFRENNRGPYTSGGEPAPADESSNWRARPTAPRPSPPPSTYNSGQRQPYSHSRPEPQYQPPHTQPPSSSHHQQYQDSYNQPRYNQYHDQPSNHSPNQEYNNQSGSNNRPLSSSSEERPKLVLQKRKTPLNVDDVSSSRNEAIFGQAKPSSTPYEKMKEVEEKLNAVQITDKK